MSEVMQALQRSVISLGRGRIWLYILGPALAAFVLMLILLFTVLGYLIASFLAQPPMLWLADSGALWLAKALAVIGGWFLIVSASYLLTVVLTAVFVLPLLLDAVAQADYPDLARLGTNSLAAATWNSVTAAFLFLLGWGLTLPLWLIPGLGMILPAFWLAWLNRRTFAYDSLALHASHAEWDEIRRHRAGPLFLLGLSLALFSHLPFVGLFAPSLAALAYIHFGLESLRRLRQGAVLMIPGGERREK